MDNTKQSQQDKERSQQDKDYAAICERMEAIWGPNWLSGHDW